MVKLAGIFRSIQPFSALVIGDFMLDTYTTGKARRVSPEAPVLVMHVESIDSRPGGAGNVVLNLATLGARVKACGRIGRDKEGEELLKTLTTQGVDVSGMIVEERYQTPIKNRLIADSQQLLRVDFETVSPLPSSYEAELISYLEKEIQLTQVVAVSDYGKGFLTNTLLAAIIDLGRKANVPVVVDPKGIDFTKYRGAYLLKPNLSEAYAAAKLPNSTLLDSVASELLKQTEVDLLLITRSEAGISLFDQHQRTDFPVQSKEVKDVTGAGDTVLSMICMALANGLDINSAVRLANIGAGIAIERLGCVQVTLSEIARRLLETNSDYKIFDEDHLFALRQVLQGKRYLLLVLNSDQTMTNTLFRTLRDLSSRGEEVLVYIRGPKPDLEFLQLLSSLHEVSFVILETESLKHLCEAIEPYEIYFLNKDTLAVHQGENLLSTLLDVVVKSSLSS